MKRPSEVQLTKDNPEEQQDDSANEKDSHTFQRASADVLAKRRIIKVRRTVPPNSDNEKPASNPFAKLSSDVSSKQNDQTDVSTDKKQQAHKDSKSNDKVENVDKNQLTETEKKKTDENESKKDHIPSDEDATNGKLDNSAHEDTKAKQTSQEDDLKKKEVDNEDRKDENDKQKDEQKTEEKNEQKDETKQETNNLKSTEQPLEKPARNTTEENTEKPSNEKPTTMEKQSTKSLFVFGGSAPTLTFASAAKTDTTDPFNLKKTAHLAAPVSKEKKPEYQQADTKTGEEDEEELHRFRAKLYRLETNEKGQRWRERGVGQVKLNRHKQTGKVRLLMRTEATLKVVLNTLLFKEMNLDRATERSIRFQGFDSVDSEQNKDTEKNENTVDKIAGFLLRLSTRDSTTELIDAIEKLKPKE